MERQPECLVSGPTAFVLRILQFLGIAPLCFTKTDNGWRVCLSRGTYICGSILAVIASMITTWTVVENFRNKRLSTSGSITRHVAQAAEVLIVTLTWLVMVHSASTHMRCMISSLDQLRKIALELKIPQWSPKWKKTPVGVFISWNIISLICILIDAASTFIYIPHTTWFKISGLLYFAYYVGIQGGIILFILLVLQVRSIFRAVNDSLKNLIKDMEQQHVIAGKNSHNKANNAIKKINNYVDTLGDSKAVKIYSGDVTICTPHHETVHRIASAFASACDVVRDVDRSYGLSLMLLLTSIFMHLVTEPYYFITNLVECGNVLLAKEWIIMAEGLKFFWIVYHATKLITVIEPCHLTHAEIEYTSKLVSRLMRRVESIHEPLAIELEQFCRQLTLNDVSYRPLNITTMDRGLVLAILGSITTYLVILVDINN